MMLAYGLYNMNINDEHELVNVNDVSLRAVQHARERVNLKM